MSNKQYKILCLETQDYYTSGGVVKLYTDGKQAQRDAVTLSQMRGTKHQVRPHIVDTKWREREARRFYDGLYYPVPWDSEGWYQRSEMCKDHYAHISVETDVRIAYTPNEDMGIADRQTRIKPGRYLEQYFGERLNGDTIRRFVSEFSILHEDIKVKFAKTADEIERVYMNGPTSCMDNRHAHTFKSKKHPVRVYAGPDLAVAYLDKPATEIRKKVCRHCTHLEGGCPDGAPSRCEGGKDSIFSARAVVWPEKKIYGRIYGDTDRLALALKRDGFKSGPLEGARITRITMRGIDGNGVEKDGFVAPYIDDPRNIRDDGTYLILDRNGTHQTGQSGFAADNRMVCVECNLPQHTMGGRVLSPNGQALVDMCQGCWDTTERKRRRVRDANTGHWARAVDCIVLGPGQSVHTRFADQHIVVCSKTFVPLWIGSSDAIMLADGSYVSLQWYVEANLKTCNYCGAGQPEGDFKCAQYTNCHGKPEWTAMNGTALHRSQVSEQMGPFQLMSYEDAHALAGAQYLCMMEKREAEKKALLAAKRREAQRLRRRALRQKNEEQVSA